MAFSGVITRSAAAGSGTHEVTGCGGTPWLLIFLGSVDGVTTVWSNGKDNGTHAACSYANTGGSNMDQSNSIRIVNSIGNGYTAKITAKGSDGFTLTFTIAGIGAAITITWLAI